MLILDRQIAIGRHGGYGDAILRGIKEEQWGGPSYVKDFETRK